ncbi:MAG TPA: ATP-binding protein [Rhizomicrobium sp.]
MAPASTSDEQAITHSAQDELTAERAQFALAERAARFGYWRVRLADGHCSWSPGMYRLLGVEQDRAPDMAWLMEQINQEDAVVITRTISEAIKARKPFSYRNRARYPDVASQIVDTHGEVEIGPDGRVVAIIGVCNDVTQQVTAETARAEAEEMYRMMTEQASDIIMLHALGGKVLFASNALGRILGLKPDDFDEGGYMAFVHPDDFEEASKLGTVPLPGQTLTATYRARHADGHYVWIEGTTRGAYEDSTGQLRHIIGVSRDVSERKVQEIKMQAARESAEAASRAKSGFLASMSHELRTPLNAILGFADIMREEMFGRLGNDRYVEYAGLIHDSGQHLLDLISDILDMAKIEAGKMELHFERVDLAGTVEDCARLLAERARDSGVQIISEVPVASIPLIADSRALKQILLNLLANSVKFTPRGGHVWISVKATGDRVNICVRDDGIGIPEEALPRLGRAFEQVTTDSHIAKTGTGLGLALVRALAEKHGGGLTIESQVGDGTTVTVTLAHAPQTRIIEAA